MFNFPLFIVFLYDNFLELVVFYCIFLAKKKGLKKGLFVKKTQKFGIKMSKRFGSLFLYHTEWKLWYSVNSVRSYTVQDRT